MTTLPASRQQWQAGGFEQTLKHELENLPTGTLPLEQGTSRGGLVDDGDIAVTVIDAKANGSSVEATIGVFFTEIVGGCSCGDDPAPENAYCEMRVYIDLTTAAAEFELIQ